jgi:hypothetical protein
MGQPESLKDFSSFLFRHRLAAKFQELRASHPLCLVASSAWFLDARSTLLNLKSAEFKTERIVTYFAYCIAMKHHSEGGAASTSFEILKKSPSPFVLVPCRHTPGARAGRKGDHCSICSSYLAPPSFIQKKGALRLLLSLGGKPGSPYLLRRDSPINLTTSAESIGLRSASQIVAHPVDWLWPGRLPLGKLAILDGDPGPVCENPWWLKLIDGHLRRDLDPDMLDVSEDEARALLLSIDPLAALAQTQEQIHRRLLDITPTDFEELKAAWRATAESRLKALSATPAAAACPAQFLILLTCRDEHRQVELLNRLGGEGLECRALLS